MITDRQAMLVRWSVVASLLLFILSVTLALIKYPIAVTSAGAEAVVYIILLTVALLIYGWFALFRTRTATTAERITLRQGAFWGLLCGAAWAVELLVGNLPVFQPGPLTYILYGGTALLGFLLPGIASLLAAYRTRRIVSGLQAGLLCGMFGALIIFLTALVCSPILYKALFNDPQTIAEFRSSGLPDMTTYIVSDALAALIGHLWIGLITGSLLGILGGAVGKAIFLPQKTSREGDHVNS